MGQKLCQFSLSIANSRGFVNDPKFQTYYDSVHLRSKVPQGDSRATIPLDHGNLISQFKKKYIKTSRINSWTTTL
jgi:hypothetical protein